MKVFAVVVVSFARKLAAATMTTTSLSLTDNILAAHSAQLAEMKAETVAETAEKHGYPLPEGRYPDDLFLWRFKSVLVYLRVFVKAYNRDRQKQMPIRSSYTIENLLLTKSHPSTELGCIEKLILEFSTDPSTKFTIWALGEMGLKAVLTGGFRLNDGCLRGSLWIEVD
jgi:hypothetical protein